MVNVGNRKKGKLWNGPLMLMLLANFLSAVALGAASKRIFHAGRESEGDMRGDGVG